jgi:CubicO group peptidase (beta-lactamase class C family)
MKRKHIVIALLVIFGTIGVYVSIPQNQYIVRALIHQRPDIDDYKIFANRTIEKGEAQPWQQHVLYNSYDLSIEERAILENYKTVSYLVARDSQLLFEAYWDGYGPESLSNSFSMAKSIVSLLIGCAIDDGFIKSLDQPVADFIPEFKNDERSKITIRHLLLMSSGLSWDEAYASLFSITTQAYYGKDVRSLAVNQSVITEPGKAYNYLSGDTQLLSLIVAKATGKTLSEYASERIWKRIGAEHDAIWSLDKEGGYEKAYCCFNSNARDFARFGILMLNNGKWGNDQVISEEYVNASLAPATFLTDPELGGKPNERYGYQWWITKHKGYDIKFARGIKGQYIFIIPELRLVAVRLGHTRSEERIEGNPIDIFQFLDIAISINSAAN